MTRSGLVGIFKKSDVDAVDRINVRVWCFDRKNSDLADEVHEEQDTYLG